LHGEINASEEKSFKSEELKGRIKQYKKAMKPV
jgi:hypothetical protein